MSKKTIILGGGCFWCIESIFQEVKGVSSVVSGYAGGFDKEPTYKTVCSGVTGHTEVVKLDYDDAEIALDAILEIFFTLHNPTTLNRQGNDVGTQYRSAVYYTDDADLDNINTAVANAESLWGNPVVTEVKKDIVFYPAEAYHQNYFRTNPTQGYCNYVVAPKIVKLRRSFTKYLSMVMIMIMMAFGMQAQPIILSGGPQLVKETIEGIPTLRLNFYLMDYEPENEAEVVEQIAENIKYMNEEFEDAVKFVHTTTYKDGKQVFLPEIYADFYNRDGSEIKDFTDRIEKQGGINIYVCTTYLEDDGDTELLGFTPVLKAKRYAYQLNSPRFDRIFISYSGLREQKTLVHEMGHFLGLQHPWRLHPLNLELQGLTSDELIDHNHMSYTDKVHQFTTEQLDRMQHFALQFRRYLCETIELDQK